MSIRALAAELNISIGTVSRALNDRPDVNEETRKKVLETAERLGYAPRLSGTSLRNGRTKTIGFMIETTGFTSIHGESFFMTIFDGLQNLFGSHDLDLIVLLCGSNQDPYEYLKRIVQQRFVDGVILSAIKPDDERVSFLTASGLPFVTLGRTGTNDTHPWADLDLDNLAAQSVARFVSQGYRRIGLIKDNTGLNVDSIIEKGFRAYLAEAGLSLDENHVLTVSPDDAGGYRAATELLAQTNPPDAVFLVAEAMAMGVYRRLSEVGKTAGRDLGVIGQRNNPLCRSMQPSLTAFDVDLNALGAALGRLLLSHIPHFRSHFPVAESQLLWPLTLYEGESDAKQTLT
ncbi:MAG: LacI family DNA-binding transcriptional regulator [Pseudomonadota bacterium]